MIVDAHLHLFESADAYQRGTHPLYPSELRAPIDEFVAVMDDNGVDHAVVVPLDHHDDYLVEVLRAEPDRFRGIGVLDETDPDPVGSTRRRAEEVGIRGLRLGQLGAAATTDPAQLERLPLLETMAELGLVLWFYGPPAQQAMLGTALEAVPDLQVVLNHLGFCPEGYDVDAHGRPRIDTPLPPPTLDTTLALAANPNVSVMFSGQYAFSNTEPPFPDLDETVRAVGEAFGLGRLLWASDWPWIRHVPGYRTQMTFVDHFFDTATPADRSAVMGGNAARLFGFGEA